MRFASVLVVALLLAGCSEPSEPPATASTSTSASPTASSSSSTTAAPAAPTTQEVPYSFQGRTWTAVCAFVTPAGAGDCQTVAEGSDLTQPFGEDGIVRVRGTLTWTDGNEVVGIGLVWEEDGELQASPEFYADGPSPLSFDWDVAALANRSLAYHVSSYVSAGVPQAHADASPGQDWTLEATLTVRSGAA